ncbi:nicotinate-nucleotide--dimethylbenzimidazole phosphoribosyltransferase [Treponema pedis]|uniref:Nicotinate-nucleotide--dimethylbenzimidazole phosphoribosyltransferase n=1 Tax=Treponema pedis TaxID=409322 RepID=A0A7S7AXL4_9SPIR|nr:nicotinate-nucleotide--dimethylbenzimidazole phosphoribosyltransferase [Treponema pedis]QOW62092.1 nicotinate-nucleotide--dimethylbenzimidazole phosphoribosyltransferase [Treponema pedis]
MLLQKTLASITSVERSYEKKAKLFWDSLAHPPGSLGELEEITVRLAKIQKTLDLHIDKKVTIVFCADNGVYAEKITSQPQITTFFLSEIMHTGQTGLGAVSKWAKSDILVYDVGMIKTSKRTDIITEKLREGTGNIAAGPAMTAEECIHTIETGIRAAERIAKEGYDIAGIGELGICNTTTTAAVLSALYGIPPEKTVGRGASTTEAMYELKLKTVKKALQVNQPSQGDVIDCISKVGGFDIAAMCGCYIGLASLGIPAVMDGYISSLAALCACSLNHKIKDYLFPSHSSQEQGAKICAEKLGLSPCLNMKMRLGEGSGCPLFFNVLEAAIFINKNMGRFTDTMINRTDLVDIRQD